MSSDQLSAAGLSIKRQADIINDLTTAWKSRFGANTNTAPETYHGQIIGIVSEQLASVYELLEDIYNSSYPSGAEGTSVDNILALNGLKRLAAAATKTDPTPIVQANGITLFGLVLTGTPGTTVPKGSLIADSATPAHVFAIDADATISASADAVQTVVFSNTPNAGSYALVATTSTGSQLTTSALPATSTAADVQAALVAVVDPSSKLAPYTDVEVTAVASGYTVAFGYNNPSSGMPSSGEAAQPLLTIANNTLRQDTVVTNISVSETVQGSPAEAIATATAIDTGPSSVSANSLTVIQTPISGWTGVNNPLDCISGSNTESDSDALARRATLLANQAQGPLNAVVQRVREVPGVSQALAFPNTTNAALQSLSFASVPTSGTYVLAVGVQATSPIPFNANAQAIQTALQALSGFAFTKVTGSLAYGFMVDFNGSMGGQAVPKMVVTSNTTGIALNSAFARSPKSLEIVVEGGTNAAVAEAIYASAPAGISTYGSPVLTTTATVTASQATMSVANTSGLSVGVSVQCQGITPGTTITAISGNNLTLSAQANNSYTNVAAVFSNTTPIADSNGNTVLIGFSRPQPIPIYINLKLITDSFNTPGDSTSGMNVGSKWNAASVATIQAQLLAIGNSLPIGASIVARGTSGLLGSFNGVQGIEDYQLTFGVTPDTTNTAPIQLLAEQVAQFESFNIHVSWV